MSSLTEKGLLREVQSRENFAYVLSQGVSVQPTEYRVMQNNNVNCLVNCMRMKYNGQEALYYQTAGMKSFQSVLPSYDGDNAASLIGALLKSIIELRNIGFLSCTNIDNSLNKVYVDYHTNRVRLVYLPIDKHFYPDDMTFENEFRSALVKRIDELAVSSARLSNVRKALIDATLSLENILNGNFTSNRQQPASPGSAPGPQRPKPQMTLTALNVQPPVVLNVNRDEYRIGKLPDMDGVITFNNYIGREHCKIVWTGSGYAVVDLNSRNGSFVNKVRLHPMQPQLLQNGDVLRLANCDFRVTIR